MSVANIVRLPKTKNGLKSARALAEMTQTWNEMTPMQRVGFIAAPRTASTGASDQSKPQTAVWRNSESPIKFHHKEDPTPAESRVMRAAFSTVQTPGFGSRIVAPQKSRALAGAWFPACPQ